MAEIKNTQHEQRHALREGHEIAASARYFEARPQIDTHDRRKVFGAGFVQGWDAAEAAALTAPPVVRDMTDEDMDRLITLMGRHDRAEIGHQGLVESIVRDFADRAHALRAALTQGSAIAAGPPCDKPPSGWLCKRQHGHHGPCAAEPTLSERTPDWVEGYAAGIADGRTDGLLAAHGQAPAQPDQDGETFRTAARLGLTLRFYGGCAQSGMPGTPSTYEVVSGQDRAAAMREAVERAVAVISQGGESQRLEATPSPQAAQQVEGGDVERMNWLEADEGKCVFNLGKTWYTRPRYGLPYRKRTNLRAAIDAAMADAARAAQKEGAKPC